MAFRLRGRRSLSLVNQFLCNKQKPATVSPPPVSHLLHVSASPTLSFSTTLTMRPFTSTTTLFMSYRGKTFGIGPDFGGCDYNHWLITIDFPKDANLSREQMIDTYVNTAAQVFGSVAEAKKKIYALSTKSYHGFQVECTEETSEKFKGLPGVVDVLPNPCFDPVNKDYGGDKYVNGDITPRPPPEGCDYNHWLITIDFPKDANLSREQMIETYVNTAAQVFGSVGEAKKKIYALSTTTYHGFQVECTEETSEKFEGLPGVSDVLPNPCLDPVNNDYGGDKYVNGDIIPRPVRSPRPVRRPHFLEHYKNLKDLSVGDLFIKGGDMDPNKSINLLTVAGTGNAAFLNEVLEAGLDPDVGDSKGRTALHIAASNGHDECVRVLLRRVCSLRLKDLNGNTALWNAIESKHHTVFKTLYHWVSISDPYIAGDLLTEAVRTNDLTVMNDLCKNGVCVDSKDRNGLSAIEVATNECFIFMVKFLLLKGVEVNEKVSEKLSWLIVIEKLMERLAKRKIELHMVLRFMCDKEKEQLQESTDGIVSYIFRGHPMSREEQTVRLIKPPNSLGVLRKIAGMKFKLLNNECFSEIDSIEVIRE